MSPVRQETSRTVPLDGHPADSPRVSRAIYAFQHHSTHPAVAVTAIAVSVVSLVAALTSRAPDHVLVWFAGVASAVTLPMLFILQHTQSRHQIAIQRKLDEVLHALPEADNRLIRLETASDTDLHAVAQKHSVLLEEANQDGPAS